MPRALIVWGGWEGHRPREVAEILASLLGAEGYDTVVTSDYAALGSPDIADMDLVVPVITNDEIDRDIIARLTAAVRSGVGLAGAHTPTTAFRRSVDYHFLMGAQWVAHPGNVTEFRVEVTRPDDPIMQGVASFNYRSEQYYLHYDPSIEILATTTFSGQHEPAASGVTMPVVYKRRLGRGRIFYTALGHAPEEFAHPEARMILRRGLLWATRGER